MLDFSLNSNDQKLSQPEKGKAGLSAENMGYMFQPLPVRAKDRNEGPHRTKVAESRQLVRDEDRGGVFVKSAHGNFLSSQQKAGTSVFDTAETKYDVRTEAIPHNFRSNTFVALSHDRLLHGSRRMSTAFSL